MKNKLCPLALVNGKKIECLKNECAWWVRPHTTERVITTGMCAMEVIAMKNSDGHYVV